MKKAELIESVLSQYSTAKDIETYRKRASEGLREWERRIVERYMPPGCVLSIGCGGGRESFALESLGFVAFGVDITKEQVENANATRDAMSSHATFLHYQGTSLPFDDAFFDSVTLWSQVLGNVPGEATRLELLRECLRVLKPGGIVSMSVHDREKTSKNISGAGYSSTIPDAAEPGDLLLTEGKGEYCYWHYFDETELASLCKRAGFEVVLDTTSDCMGQSYDNLHILVCSK